MNQYSFTEKDHTFKRIMQELYEDIYDKVQNTCHTNELPQYHAR